MSQIVVRPHQHQQSTPATPTSTPTTNPTPIPSCPDTPARTPTRPPLRRHQRERQHQHQNQRQLQPQPQPQPLRQQPAAEGSLRSLLLQHSSKRLYVHPLEWTALHLSVLCCNVIVHQPIIQHRCPQQQQRLSQTRTPTPHLRDALEVLDELRRLDEIGFRNSHSRKLITLLGLGAQPDCRIVPGTLLLRYNQNPVCPLRVPLMARYKGRIQWVYIDSSWINELHENYKPRENIFCAQKRRARSEEGLPISPFCLAIMLAMAQQVAPQQQVTLFLPNHERQPPPNSARIISTIYEYRLEASQTYLQKFEQPYNVFESNLTVHRRIIPLKQETFQLLSQAVQCAASECKQAGYQAGMAADAVKEGVTTIFPRPLDSNKRKAISVAHSNIPSKWVKSSNRNGGID